MRIERKYEPRDKARIAFAMKELDRYDKEVYGLNDSPIIMVSVDFFTDPIRQQLLDQIVKIHSLLIPVLTVISDEEGE